MTYKKDLKEKYNSIVLLDEPMKNHCTFKVGGPADVLISPKNIGDFLDIINYVRDNNIEYFIMGNGSNLIVLDGGFKGVIIKMKSLTGINFYGEFVEVLAGNNLRETCYLAYENSLSGLEFAYGIPGTVGGAIFMNAGAYGGEINDIIHSCRVLDKFGNIKELYKEQLNLSYRHSILQDEDMIAISCKFKLKNGDIDAIKMTMDENMFKRNSKQPVDKPSGGSTFKRPKGNFAGKLIMDSGLSGYRIGGAKVSEKHCGFVINDNNGTAKDVLDLINYIKDVVFEKSNIKLETEVKIIGHK